MRFDGTSVTRFYPKLTVYGANFQGSFLNGILSVEGGIYDSREDRKGTDPTVENGQARFLVGYQKVMKPCQPSWATETCVTFCVTESIAGAPPISVPLAVPLRPWEENFRAMFLSHRQVWQCP